MKIYPLCKVSGPGMFEAPHEDYEFVEYWNYDICEWRKISVHDLEPGDIWHPIVPAPSPVMQEIARQLVDSGGGMKIYPPENTKPYRTGHFARPTSADVDSCGYVLYWARGPRAWTRCSPDSLVAGDVWRKNLGENPSEAVLDISNQFYNNGTDPDADT